MRNLSKRRNWVLSLLSGDAEIGIWLTAGEMTEVRPELKSILDTCFLYYWPAGSRSRSKMVDSLAPMHEPLCAPAKHAKLSLLFQNSRVK